MIGDLNYAASVEEGQNTDSFEEPTLNQTVAYLGFHKGELQPTLPFPSLPPPRPPLRRPLPTSHPRPSLPFSPLPLEVGP